MTTDTVPQTVLFPDLFDKPLFARFNQEQASSDGGAILLKAAERIYGLVKAFAGCLFDKRAPDKTRHSLADLIGQRIFGIACGHPDCNDGDHDGPEGRKLLTSLGPQVAELALVMDRAYQGDETRQLALDLGFTPVVPPIKTRTDPWEYDREMYKRRNEVERLFRRLKGYRRIFSRFDKLDVMFIGFIHFVLMFDALR